MKYKIYFEQNNKLNNITLEANSISLLKQNTKMPLNIIYIKQKKAFNFNAFFQKNEKLDLIYELKTMLDSQLVFEDIINILISNTKNKQNLEVLFSIKTALENGQDIYKALEVHKKYLGTNTILFFKIAQKNSNMKVSMNALYEILYQDFKLKEQIIQILTYPTILFISLIISLTIIFNFVIPKFEYIFISYGSNLPYTTEILLNVKYIVSSYFSIILIVLLLFILLLKLLYNKYIYHFDKFIFLNIPIFSSMYQNILFYRLFISIYLITKSKNKFYDALKNSQDVISNVYLKSKLNNILKDINNGTSISQSFLNTNIFDNSTISLLNIAQKTNKLEYILSDIKNIYDKNLQKTMKKFKAFLEPFLIFIISSIVLYIVLAIMTPIWDLSTVIN